MGETAEGTRARAGEARAWFTSLRDRFVEAFEALEREAPEALFPEPRGRFQLTPWRRETGGGGVMGFLRGRLFEKCALHLADVEGVFSEEMAASMPSVAEDRRFTAVGLSLIAHLRSPKIPAVHLNTRYLATSAGWFGGGADLTPLLEVQRHQDSSDAGDFHAAMKGACESYDPACYARFKAECDAYFFLPHRGEPRGIGGIFFDRLASGDFVRDFAFVRRVGEACLEVWPRIARRRMIEAWSDAEREEQLVRRGRYVEFNLLYDRGTAFGLKTGGNVETILSSLPPKV
ncbi:MAG: oxygen-dependent coproporphyrinogen oxidase, partial [Caulobacteraceae bacterium]